MHTVELGEGGFLVVLEGVQHLPTRSLTVEPIVMLIEPETTLNTGDAKGSDLTVDTLKRLV